MTNIRLQNPYFDETIKVKESCKHILNRNPLLNYRHKLIDTEAQNVANNSIGGAR